jgi:hypothetical protein
MPYPGNHSGQSQTRPGYTGRRPPWAHQMQETPVLFIQHIRGFVQEAHCSQKICATARPWHSQREGPLFDPRAFCCLGGRGATKAHLLASRITRLDRAWVA